MNNIQETLLFPVRDEEARKQFLLACLAVLAGYIIPILPFLILTGYCARIMRQIVDERKSPSMPDWQGSDLSEMLADGARLYGAQIVLSLPLLLVMGCGAISIFGSFVTISLASDESMNALMQMGVMSLIMGIGSMMLFALLSVPYGIIITAAGPHVVAKNSFSAAFQLKEWWDIFRKGLGQFILAYAVIMVLSLIFVFVTQIFMFTIVFTCLIPLILIPYSAYLVLVMNTLYAQAYVAGRDALEIK